MKSKKSPFAFALLLLVLPSPLFAQSPEDSGDDSVEEDSENDPAASGAVVAESALRATTAATNARVAAAEARSAATTTIQAVEAGDAAGSITAAAQAADAANRAATAATEAGAAAQTAVDAAQRPEQAYVYSSNRTGRSFSRPTTVHKCQGAWRPYPDGAAIENAQSQRGHELAPEGARFWIIGEENGVTRIRFLQWDDGWQRWRLNGDQAENGERNAVSSDESIRGTNSYTWCISSATMNGVSEEIYPTRFGVSAGALTIPFKIRVGQDQLLDANAGLSASFGLFVEPRNPNIRLSVLTAAGVTSVNFTNTDGEAASGAAFSMAVGISAQFYNVGVGLLLGWDWLVNDGASWEANGEPWIGLSLGAGLLNTNFSTNEETQ